MNEALLREAHLIFVVGPTACGKTDLAINIAEHLQRPAEIINCDSVQFFAGVDIGAAKPTPEELKRATHHLVGHVPLGGEYTAGDFRRDALRVVEERVQAGVKHFLPAGGSGFYVQALEKGMYEVPPVPPDIREQLESEMAAGRITELHRELVERDPEASKKIPAADRYRILRTLEILRAQPGSTLTEIRARFGGGEKSPFKVSKVGAFRSRDILRTRVTERTKKMIANGLIDEVVGLREKGLSDWSPMKSVGYQQVQDFLDQKLTREELEPAIVTATMQLAKRQMTWFKRDSSIRWFNAEVGWDEAVTYARSLLAL